MTVALGAAVRCPRCGAAFEAVEEAALVVPGPGWVPPPTPPPPRYRPSLLTPPESDEFEFEDRDDDWEEEDEGPGSADSHPQPDPDREHDPHAEGPGGSPASVFIGLALLPFLIPIVWLIAPAVIGQPPMVTLAAPLSLALAASVLCLAVISTVDWRHTTRIRGVLLVLALSYLTGVGLYFLDKATVNRVQEFFNPDLEWKTFDPHGAGYKVKMPEEHPRPVAERPLQIAPLACHEARHPDNFRDRRFVVGSSVRLPNKPALGTDAWFDRAADELAAQANARPAGAPVVVEYRGKPCGRQVVLTLPDGKTRVARVYVIGDRVYYLAAEGPGLEPDEPAAAKFFSSFEVVEK
jgi:hypothetical protein